jgi:hypothetical protein
MYLYIHSTVLVKRNHFCMLKIQNSVTHIENLSRNFSKLSKEEKLHLVSLYHSFKYLSRFSYHFH